ncbi:MAG TPA: DUF2293 domain-containing protein [Fimbriimonadaceae bacterium]|jgi:hypothetical protein
MEEPKEKAVEIAVFYVRKEATCAECGAEMMKGEFLRMENGSPLCMNCADLGELYFLPSGNTALTRRAKKYSSLHAVVLKWSTARKRYERQGLMVEEQAWDRAALECAEDEPARQLARERAAVKREHLDEKFIDEFERRIRNRYPNCPKDSAHIIALHACQKHSGRVGRSAAAKSFEPHAIDLAVRAHIRHVHTPYDRYLLNGTERKDARDKVAGQMEETLDQWRG